MQKFEARVDKIQYDFKKLSTQSHSRFCLFDQNAGKVFFFRLFFFLRELGKA